MRGRPIFCSGETRSLINSHMRRRVRSALPCGSPANHSGDFNRTDFSHKTWLPRANGCFGSISARYDWPLLAASCPTQRQLWVLKSLPFPDAREGQCLAAVRIFCPGNSSTRKRGSISSGVGQGRKLKTFQAVRQVSTTGVSTNKPTASASTRIEATIAPITNGFVA